MIYTITPNPSLDLGGMVDKVIPNEKAYVHDETRFPGGNAINAARIIKKLKQPVIAGGFLGGGIGKEVESLLKQENVHCQFTSIQGHTRIGVTVSDRNTHRQTRFSFPGPKVRPQEVQRLAHWVKAISPPALLVIGGSLPPGFSPTALKSLIKLAHTRGIPCIIDVPGPILKEMIPSRPLLIKPNLTEFQELIGKKVTSIQEVTREALKLNSMVPFICISSVEDGALLVTRDRVCFGKTPKIQVKTTVGAGDSMVGAMAAKIWKQKGQTNLPDLLRWGLAAAAATLITPGTMLGDVQQMRRYYALVRIKEISI